jgi:hypothetical protein
MYLSFGLSKFLQATLTVWPFARRLCGLTVADGAAAYAAVALNATATANAAAAELLTRSFKDRMSSS